MAMSIDVEDWFHVENMIPVAPRQTWRERELRAERAMDRMLELMAVHDVNATCFVLGWVADRAPQLVQRIVDAGHEIASHGYHHDPVHRLTPAEFRSDVQRSKDTLEELTSSRVCGYRAPSFSLTDWAIPILEEVGFQYDSSFFPTSVMRDRYGKPNVFQKELRSPTRVGELIEVPLPCLELGRHTLPWAGGAYFRLLPYDLFTWGVRKIVESGRPYVFYLHPWELDTTQPRVPGLSRSVRIRHYRNLEKTESRWSALLRDFTWTTIQHLLEAEDRGGNMYVVEASEAADGATRVRT